VRRNNISTDKAIFKIETKTDKVHGKVKINRDRKSLSSDKSDSLAALKQSINKDGLQSNNKIIIKNK